MNYPIFSLLERPEDADGFRKVVDEGWDIKFLSEADNPEVADLFKIISCYFSDFCFGLYDNDRVIAVIDSIPVFWDGKALSDSGWNWAVENAMQSKEANIAPNALCALAIIVSPSYQNRGISGYAIKAIRSKAQEYGFSQLIIPVRPSLKASYPLTPIEHYIKWTHTDGSPFDPWLRVHWRAGAYIAQVASQSITIRDKVSQWESWTKMRFPESGKYVIPNALTLLQVQLEQDQATYIEPNVWMIHDLR